MKNLLSIFHSYKPLTLRIENRVGPDIRPYRIIRPAIRYPEKSRIIRHIRQGMPDNPAGYPLSGKKNHIRPNPSICTSSICSAMYKLINSFITNSSNKVFFSCLCFQVHLVHPCMRICQIYNLITYMIIIHCEHIYL